jgi:hypothetical protein
MFVPARFVLMPPRDCSRWPETSCSVPVMPPMPVTIRLRKPMSVLCVKSMIGVPIVEATAMIVPVV